MRIDVVHRAAKADIAMEIAVADVDVGLVSVEVEVGMGDRASQVRMLVGMRINMPAAIRVAVDVNRVGVVVVTVRVD